MINNQGISRIVIWKLLKEQGKIYILEWTIIFEAVNVLFSQEMFLYFLYFLNIKYDTWMELRNKCSLYYFISHIPNLIQNINSIAFEQYLIRQHDRNIFRPRESINIERCVTHFIYSVFRILSTAHKID